MNRFQQTKTISTSFPKGRSKILNKYSHSDKTQIEKNKTNNPLPFPTLSHQPNRGKTQNRNNKKGQKTKQYGFLTTNSKWGSPSLGLKSFLKSIVPKN